ncbi:hypothetical protein IL54_4127 [Sphingobium sp. ba1]|nr:hypothetical protein IL54_4127 [Sphingobium sp. ba1]
MVGLHFLPAQGDLLKHILTNVGDVMLNFFNKKYQLTPMPIVELHNFACFGQN